MTAWDAMWSLAEPGEVAAWREAEALQASDDDPVPAFSARKAIEDRLRWRLSDALAAGDMLAEGWPDDGGPSALIPPPAWQRDWRNGLRLRINQDGSADAEDAERVWAGLRFRRAVKAPEDPQAHGAPPAAEPAPLDRRAKVKARYHEYMAFIGRSPDDGKPRPSQQSIVDAIRGPGYPRDLIREVDNEVWEHRPRRPGRPSRSK